MSVYLLSGEQNSGKSTAIQKLASYLGNVCGGVICPPIYHKGKKIGTDALDLMTGKKVPFARLKYSPRGISVGRYSIQPAGISHGLEAIDRAIEAKRLVIIDEVGPMEVQGRGLYTGIKKALVGISDVLLVVRSSQKREVLNSFCVGTYIPLNMKTDATAQWQRIANYNSNKCI